MKLPKYRRHSSRDRAFVEHNGRRTYLPGTYGSTESREAYRRYLHDHVLTDAPPPAADRHTITCGDAFSLYLAYVIRRFGSANREAGHVTVLCERLLQHFGDGPLDTFSVRHLKLFRDDLATKGLARSYVNATVRRAIRMFRWLTSEELYPATLLVGLQTIQGLRQGESPARESEPRRPVDYYAIYPALWCMTPAVRTMVLMQWYTGARSANVCQARLGEIDRTTRPWAWRPARHKNTHRGGSLTIYLGPQCERVLTWLLDRPTDAYLFSPRSAGRSPSTRDTYSPQSYRMAVVRAQRRAGGVHWTPHQLRHGRATMVRARYGLEAAQAALGHESIDVTQIYAQRHLELARKVASEIG